MPMQGSRYWVIDTSVITQQTPLPKDLEPYQGEDLDCEDPTHKDLIDRFHVWVTPKD